MNLEHDEKRLVSYHEAGHALIGIYNGLPVRWIEIYGYGGGEVRNAWWFGYARRWTERYAPVAVLEFVLAGRAAESLCHPPYKVLVQHCRKDEAIANRIARETGLDIHAARSDVETFIEANAPVVAALAEVIAAERALGAWQARRILKGHRIVSLAEARHAQKISASS
ncbi:MAG TPA: hypothetical protein VLB83_04770 [Candidatus Paceibacterota bacterium]|nr:hypothetical protein [Candidatus Paceibacterota bacterium]